MPEITAVASGQLAAILNGRYGLAASELVQLPIGQGTVNFRATCPGRDVFVKTYPADADLPGERDAIGLSELAGRNGVAIAAVLRNRDGQVIDTTTEIAVSVWEWMPGKVVTSGLTTSQYQQAGAALGRIHAVFTKLPASVGPAPQVRRWRDPDLGKLAADISRLLAIISRRVAAGQTDPFDEMAARTLAERERAAGEIPRLLAGLPELTAQVLHGDYSPVNLLFDGDRLSAVLDFRPPDPFLISYDLGRMAFYPNTVTSDPDWIGAAATLIGAYRDANPQVPAADIRACTRVALLQLLGSLYGVKQHYLKPGLFQDDLDQFWQLRHQAAGVLLRHLPDTDAMLSDLAAAPVSR